MKCMVIGSKHFGKKNNPRIFAEKTGADLYFWEDLVLDIKTNAVRVLFNGENILEKGYKLAICMGWYKNGERSIYRDLAYAVAKAFDAVGIEYWNKEMGDQRSITKLSQMTIMALNGVNVPATRFSLSGKQLVLGLVEGKKYVVKAVAASRGCNNYCVSSLLEVEDIIDGSTLPFLVQEFIPNDHDLRVICFGGEPKLVLKRSRTSNDTHLNNTSQGGTAEWIDLDPALAENARKISKLLGREMGGIDFIEVENLDNGGKMYYCLEINAIPQLTSGTDVERKMAALIETVNGLE